MTMAETTEKPRTSEVKREYVRPKLETLGTIRDLTLGAGKADFDDGEHPPGLNKSRFN